MRTNRHSPIRSCIGCGQRGPKADLLRIVRDASGGLFMDGQGRAEGRGGYLHRNPACWSEFSRRKGLVRSLRTVVDRSARAALISELRDGFGD